MAWRLFRKLGIESPYDPAIQVLGICSEDTKFEKDSCIPLFIAGLSTIARTWKQPRCSSTDEWIKKLLHIYNGILLSHKKEDISVNSNEADE